MSDEIKTFDVVNTSVRLVHLGSLMIPPGPVAVPVIDDPKGINRQMVEDSEELDFAENVTVKETKPAKNAKPVSATGTSWK